MANRQHSFVVGSWVNGGPENDPATTERIRIGLASLPALADDLETTAIWIVTNARESFTKVRTIQAAVDSILGAGAAKRLERGEAVQWSKYTVHNSTTRTLSSDPVGGAVLAVFTTAGTFKKIDNLTRRNSVIAFEFMDDAKAWKKKWKPIDLGQDVPGADEDVNGDADA